MKSDTSEKGLESLIVAAMTGQTVSRPERVGETPASYGPVGWIAGDPKDYDRDYALDFPKLTSFLQTTQPTVFAQLGIAVVVAHQLFDPPLRLEGCLDALLRPPLAAGNDDHAGERAHDHAMAAVELDQTRLGHPDVHEVQQYDGAAGEEN